MIGWEVDRPPAVGASDIKNWDEEINKKAGQLPPRRSSQHSEARVDEPPEGASLDEVNKETAADMRHNRGLREIYADKSYQLAFSCLWGWAGMLLAMGVVNGVRGKELWSDQVIIAVTTGVTVSVLAAFLGVIRGLFGGGSHNGNGKTKQ